MKNSLFDRLRCPSCESADAQLSKHDAGLDCEICGSSYPISNGRPVLLRSDNELFDLSEYVRLESSAVPEKSATRSLVPSPSVNLAEKRVLSGMRERLLRSGGLSTLVVGSGGQRSHLDSYVRPTEKHESVYCDIDVRADVDLFCDAHNLPFADGSFDAVVTTAVLEHVMYPEKVASEISRVLVDGGLLYSELPFMQQVHEGAYDFTRYTLSGHRRLFNQFEEVEAGMVAGPGTALVWALENFATSFFRSETGRKAAKLVVRCLSVWIKYFDYFLIKRPAAMDGASCTYFFGVKRKDAVSDSNIIERYVGARTLSHT